jgi:AraC-like DNA-binding protein
LGEHKGIIMDFPIEDSLSSHSPTTDDRFDATVASVGFVVRRKPSRDWKVANLVNRRYHILAYAVAGRARYSCAGQSFEVSKGQVLFFPKGLVHSGRSDLNAPWSFFSTAFDLGYANSQAEAALRALPNHVAPQNAEELFGLFSELERLWITREQGFALRCRSILLQVLYAYVRCCCGAGTAIPHSQKLAPIVAMLQSSPSRTYSSKELAAMTNLSPSRFQVLFREYTGHSVVRYQNWLRINKAKSLLLSGEYSVSEAAKEVGFLDVFYFSRLFKKLAGFNPSHFRNQ